MKSGWNWNLHVIIIIIFYFPILFNVKWSWLIQLSVSTWLHLFRQLEKTLFLIHSLTVGKSSTDSNFSTTIKQHNSLTASSASKINLQPSLQFVSLDFHDQKQLYRKMSASRALSILLILEIFNKAITQQCLSGGKQESIFGWMLRGHIYKSTTLNHGHECLKVCRQDNRCQSFNWVISTNMCEFSNRTKEARPVDFVPDPDRYYYRRGINRGNYISRGWPTRKLTCLSSG